MELHLQAKNIPSSPTNVFAISLQFLTHTEQNK